MIRLYCEPVSEIPATGSPGSAPIKLLISRLEEGGRVTISGPGVNFSGEIIRFPTLP